MSEEFQLENFPTSESALNMLDNVTHGFYDNSYVMKWLYQVMGEEYDDARAIAEDLKNQFFPETATWGLMYHEIKWGLPVRANLPYDERRKYVIEKRDKNHPMNPYWMEVYLTSMTGYEIHVEDVNDPGIYEYVPDHANRFRVVIVSEETPSDEEMQKIRNEVKKMKQSHTSCEIVVRRNLWYLDGTYLLDGTQTLNAEEYVG